MGRHRRHQRVERAVIGPPRLPCRSATLASSKARRHAAPDVHGHPQRQHRRLHFDYTTRTAPAARRQRLRRRAGAPSRCASPPDGTVTFNRCRSPSTWRQSRRSTAQRRTFGRSISATLATTRRHRAQIARRLRDRHDPQRRRHPHLFDPGRRPHLAAARPDRDDARRRDRRRQQRLFYIQDPTGDGNAATSDAIFVFTGSGRVPTVGQPGRGHRHGRRVPAERRRLRQPVDHRDRRSPASPTSASAPAVAATLIGGPAAAAADRDDRRRRPHRSTGHDGIDFYESLEGMLVTVQDAGRRRPDQRLRRDLHRGRQRRRPGQRLQRDRPDAIAARPHHAGNPDFGDTNTVGRRLQSRAHPDRRRQRRAGRLRLARRQRRRPARDVTGIVELRLRQLRGAGDAGLHASPQASTLAKETDAR